MKKEMLINVLQPEECRIAIIEDGVLEELYVERTSHESYTGNIYKGRVVNLEPAIQAAFVDFSVGRNGFLHVSDVEAQYFDRNQTGADEPAPGPRERERERDRKRDPRRDRERGRGRDDRRPLPAADPSEPPGPPPAVPPRVEDRPRERGREPQRDRDRERDRDKDRGRERERPDLSVRGRRDRSDPPPRRFGEGLIDPRDLPPLPPEPVKPRLPIADELDLAPAPEETPAPPRSAPAWTEPPVEDWDQEVSRQREREIPFGGPPEPVVEREPLVDEASEPRGRGYRPFEPVDPDLPPSRTQRTRTSALPGGPEDIYGQDRGGPRVPPPSVREPRESERPVEGAFDPLFEPFPGREREPRKGRGRGRPSPPHGRQRPVTPADREKPSIAGPVSGIGPDDLQADLDPGDTSRLDEPPRRRGGRAAIRSRGGEEVRPRDLPPAPDQGAGRPVRGYQAPTDFENERGRAGVPERPADSERRRAPEPPEPRRDRDRDRKLAHGRAGEPGYVPRRERQRSADSTFGGDLFPSGPEWPDREVEPELEDEIDPSAADVVEEDDLGFPGDAGDAAGQTKNDGRRRRRRRGRRREPERGPAKFEPAAPTPADEIDADYEDFRPGSPPSRSPARNLDPSLAGDLDELDLEDIGEDDHGALDDEDFIGDELTDERPVVVEEEIDLELEQEIRKEIQEIEELEREMGLRGPADSAGKRGDEPVRGGRPIRGRGLVKPPIQEIFRRGDEVLVQVIKESIGTKGPTLSTYISIPGRYLVLMPGLNRVGVSRKIVDEGQRRKLREIMHELNPPKGLGFIVRTAGLERTKRELARDLAYLLRLWKVILRRIKKSKAPTPIYQESDMIIRTIRDIFTSEIDTIWIDEPSAFERAQDFLKVVMPRFVNRLKLYDEKVPLFHKYGIEEEIAKIQRRHVPLPEGGSIVIDPTEALVAIDVNSGNFRVEDDAERTAYEMNLRAAKEIARQLRLRDLGGVIVNDFIDMREERHRRGVERALREAIQRDRARTKVLRMSAFGLIEMTRQRIRPSLKRSIYEDCSHCAGAGVAKTVESMAIDVMRLLALATHRDEIRRIVISVNPGVATYLCNRKRKEMAKIESECNMTIQVGFEQSSPAEFLRIECFDANNSEIRLLPPPAPTHKRGH